MSPSDVEVALRSLPRRFRAAVASATSDEEGTDALAHRAGPDGRSVIDLLAEATGGLSLLDRSLQQVLTSDGPVLPSGVVDRADREFAVQVSGPPIDLDGSLLDLEVTACAFADRVGDTPAADWTRRASIAGSSESVQAIELVQQAVAESISHLRSVEETLRAVRAT